MSCSVDAAKTFDIIQYPFMIKALEKLGTKRIFLNIIKTAHDILLNGKQLKPFL
jgi:hypothetical protein